MLAVASVSAASGCVSSSDTPSQDARSATRGLAAAIRACAGPRRADGAVDQAMVAGAGWKAVSRTLEVNGPDAKPIALDAYPTLSADAIEVSMWSLSGVSGELEVRRYWPGFQPSIDGCIYATRLDHAKDTQPVLAALERSVGHPAERKGELPRGGDFLTPRFDGPWTGYEWRLAKDVVQLSVRDREMTMSTNLAAYVYPVRPSKKEPA